MIIQVTTTAYIIPPDTARHVGYVINKVNLDIGNSGISGGFLHHNNSFIYRVNILLPKQLDANFTHSLVWTAIADADSIYKQFAPRVLKATIFQSHEEMAMESIVNSYDLITQEWFAIIDEIAWKYCLTLSLDTNEECIKRFRLKSIKYNLHCRIEITSQMLKFEIDTSRSTIPDKKHAEKRGIVFYVNKQGQKTARFSILYAALIDRQNAKNPRFAWSARQEI